jgi:hypothetical protein
MGGMVVKISCPTRNFLLQKFQVWWVKKTFPAKEIKQVFLEIWLFVFYHSIPLPPLFF